MSNQEQRERRLADEPERQDEGSAPVEEPACVNCGHPIEPDDIVCPNCGISLVAG